MCFFFFKQKTAYEMRISDWSSDVCSSDLRTQCVQNLIDRCAAFWIDVDRDALRLGIGENLSDLLARSCRQSRLRLLRRRRPGRCHGRGQAFAGFAALDLFSDGAQQDGKSVG